MDNQSKLSTLPSVDRVLASPSLAEWRESRFTTEAVREALEEIRAELRSGPAIIPPIDEIANRACRLLEKRFVPRLLRVINGTGILAHTNLGRAPLSEEAIAAMVEAARGYSTLEYDLDRGERGSRHFLVHQLLTALTGAEDALVTNNNAAALLLALTALGRRKEVIV